MLKVRYATYSVSEAFVLTSLGTRYQSTPKSARIPCLSVRLSDIIDASLTGRESVLYYAINEIFIVLNSFLSCQRVLIPKLELQISCLLPVRPYQLTLHH